LFQKARFVDGGDNDPPAARRRCGWHHGLHRRPTRLGKANAASRRGSLHVRVRPIVSHFCVRRCSKSLEHSARLVRAARVGQSGKPGEYAVPSSPGAIESDPAMSSIRRLVCYSEGASSLFLFRATLERTISPPECHMKQKNA